MSIIIARRFALLFLAAGLRAHAASFDFNSGQSNFDSAFTSNGGAGNGVATVSATGGIGNSGSLSTDGVSNHSIIFNTALPNVSGASYTTSLFFLTKSTLDTGDLVGIGFLGSSSLLWDAGNSVFYKINGTNSSNLLASTWYQLTATITNTGSTFHPVISLESYGANGTTPSGSPSTLPASDSTGGTLISSPSLYAAIYGGAYFGALSDYHTRSIDNFAVSTTAIPEPATSAVLIGLGAFGLICWHRRTRSE